jgi:hypothetical protein
MEFDELPDERVPADYARIVVALRAAGFFCQLPSPDATCPQLILATQPGGGLSFWIARDDCGVWWLVTWGGNFYTIPADVDVSEACAAVLRWKEGRFGLYSVPDEIASRFGLVWQEGLPTFGGRVLEGWDAHDDEAGPAGE